MHDGAIGFRFGKEHLDLFRFTGETAPKITDDTHILVVRIFAVNITGKIDQLLSQFLLLKRPHLSQLHIGGKLAFFQQQPNAVGNILPGQNLCVTGIPGRISIRDVHTVLCIPCRYLGISKLQTIAAVIGLLDEGQQGFPGKPLGIFNGNAGTGIVRIAANPEKLIDILLGHGKSGGCYFCTLRFCDVLDLFCFRCKEGKLISCYVRFVIRQA